MRPPLCIQELDYAVRFHKVLDSNDLVCFEISIVIHSILFVTSLVQVGV